MSADRRPGPHTAGLFEQAALVDEDDGTAFAHGLFKSWAIPGFSTQRWPPHCVPGLGLSAAVGVKPMRPNSRQTWTVLKLGPSSLTMRFRTPGQRPDIGCKVLPPGAGQKRTAKTLQQPVVDGALSAEAANRLQPLRRHIRPSARRLLAHLQPSRFLDLRNALVQQLPGGQPPVSQRFQANPLSNRPSHVRPVAQGIPMATSLSDPQCDGLTNPISRPSKPRDGGAKAHACIGRSSTTIRRARKYNPKSVIRLTRESIE